MTSLVGYCALRLWRCIELPGLAVGLALLAPMGLAARESSEVGWCFLLGISAGIGTWVPVLCCGGSEADLGLPFARTHLFLARGLAGVGFLLLFLLLAVGMGLVAAQGCLPAILCDLLAFHVVLGTSFQLLGTDRARSRMLGMRFICLFWPHCIVVVSVSALAVAYPCGDAGLPVARILALLGAFVCLGVFAATRARYLTWDVASGEDGVQGVSSAGGRTGDGTEASGRVGPSPWDDDRPVEDAAAVVGGASASHRRRSLSWSWLFVLRLGEFRLWLASCLFVSMVLVVGWWFLQRWFGLGCYGLVATHLMLVYGTLVWLVPECLQLSYLPMCRRVLFRIVCVPVLLFFLGAWLVVTPWVDGCGARISRWVQVVQDDEIQTIDPRLGRAVAFGASQAILSDDSGYTRQATLNRSGVPVSFGPYEFDASDPPSFAVHQAQRYFHDMFSLEVPGAELRAAYERAPKRWLETIDRRYARTRRANMKGRHLTAIGLVSVAVLVLVRLGFFVVHLNTRVRHVWLVLYVPVAVACGMVMILGSIDNVRLEVAIAMICDVVFHHSLPCIGIWLACCTALYLWIESAFEQLEPSASLARKRRPGLGL